MNLQGLGKTATSRGDVLAAAKTRGFAAQPEEIQKRLRLSGSKAAVLFLTRIKERPAAVLAERIG